MRFLLFLAFSLLLAMPPLSASAEQPHLLLTPLDPQQEIRLPRVSGHLSAQEIVESMSQVMLHQVMAAGERRTFGSAAWLVTEARERLGAKHWSLPMIYSFGRAMALDGVHVLGAEEEIEGQERAPDGFLVPRLKSGEVGARLQVRF